MVFIKLTMQKSRSMLCKAVRCLISVLIFLSWLLLILLIKINFPSEFIYFTVSNHHSCILLSYRPVLFSSVYYLIHSWMFSSFLCQLVLIKYFFYFPRRCDALLSLGSSAFFSLESFKVPSFANLDCSLWMSILFRCNLIKWSYRKHLLLALTLWYRI